MHRTCTIAELKEALRRPFTFPGGYTLGFWCSDGERLCPACIRENFRLVVGEKFRPHIRDQWRVEWIDVHWEGPDDYCSHCGKALPSEYGDPNPEPEEEVSRA
jgi:hypothetical protein